MGRKKNSGGVSFKTNSRSFYVIRGSSGLKRTANEDSAGPPTAGAEGFYVERATNTANQHRRNTSSTWCQNMASLLVPVLYVGIVVSSLLVFSHFYRKRNAGASLFRGIHRNVAGIDVCHQQAKFTTHTFLHIQNVMSTFRYSNRRTPLRMRHSSKLLYFGAP